jgi:hypothetical protein
MTERSIFPVIASFHSGEQHRLTANGCLLMLHQVMESPIVSFVMYAWGSRRRTVESLCSRKKKIRGKRGPKASGCSAHRGHLSLAFQQRRYLISLKRTTERTEAIEAGSVEANAHCYCRSCSNHEVLRSRPKRIPRDQVPEKFGPWDFMRWMVCLMLEGDTICYEQHVTARRNSVASLYLHLPFSTHCRL